MVSGTIIAGPKKTNYFLLVFVAAFLAIALITGNTTWSLAQVQQQFPESIIAASSSDTSPHALKLIATQQGEDEQPKKVSGFKIDLTNVVTAQVNSQVLIFVTDNSVQVIGARVRTASDQLIDLVSSTGQTNAFSLAGLPVGVYTLDIITQKGNSRAAYEGILVVSQQPTTVINETTKNVINQEINHKTRVDTVFKEKDDDDDKDNDDSKNWRDDPNCWYYDTYVCDKDGKCDSENFDCITDCDDGSSVTTGEPCPGEEQGDETGDNDKKEGEDEDRPPSDNPYCDVVRQTGEPYESCFDRKDYSETTGLYPCRDGSDVEDWRDCPDGPEANSNSNGRKVATSLKLNLCSNIL